MRPVGTIDLSQLPPPQLIEALDAESYLLAALLDYRSRYPQFSAVLESEPVIRLIEVLAYREMLLRNRVNHAARATMLAFAPGSDLDHAGAMFGVKRMTIPADPERGVEEHPEDDERFRRRIQLAPEAFSTVGPAGAYEFYALTVDGSVFDARAISPRQGEAHVVVVGANGSSVSDAVIGKLIDVFAREDVRPLTDAVVVRRAEILTYDVAVTLAMRRGPDPLLIETKAREAIAAYAGKRCVIGANVYRAGITHAASVGDVENVTVAAPAGDVICDDTQVPKLAALSVAVNVL